MMSSIACETAWRWPRRCGAPGNVTSSFARERSAISARSLRADFAVPSACSMPALTELAISPTAGRSSGASLPMPRSTTPSEPFLPRYLMRAASTAASSCASANSAFASVSSAFSSSTMATCGLLRGASKPKRRWPRRVSPRGHVFEHRQTLLRRRGLLDDGGKCGRVGDGDVRQHLAVQGHVGLLQPIDEPRVRHARQPRGGVEPRDPERAEVAPPHAAAARRLHHRTLDGLDGALVAAVAAPAEALGELQDSISTATCLEPT